MLGSETFEGVTISTARYMAPGRPRSTRRKDDEPVDHAAQLQPVGRAGRQHFILSSSVGLTRDLVKALKAPGQRRPTRRSLAEADGAGPGRARRR